MRFSNPHQSGPHMPFASHFELTKYMILHRNRPKFMMCGVHFSKPVCHKRTWNCSSQNSGRNSQRHTMFRCCQKTARPVQGKWRWRFPMPCSCRPTCRYRSSSSPVFRGRGTLRDRRGYKTDRRDHRSVTLYTSTHVQIKKWSVRTNTIPTIPAVFNLTHPSSQPQISSRHALAHRVRKLVPAFKHYLTPYPRDVS